MHRPLALSLFFLVGLSAVATSFADSTTRIFELRHASARQLAYLLGGQRLAMNPEAATTNWANNLMRAAVRQLPRNRRAQQQQQDPQWRTYSDPVPPVDPPPGAAQADAPLARVFGLPQFETLTALPDNRLLVKGEPEDIDRLAEAIRFLDKPVPQVNIDCRVEDTPAHIIRSWGLDFQTFAPQLDVASEANAPGAGPLIKWALPTAQGLLGRDEQVSRAVTISGLSITTSSGLAAEVGFGQVIPFFTSSVTYDAFGNRHVDYSVDTIFTGLQLWVLPVVLPNDMVRMTVRPVFSFAAGTVQGPNGEQVPVTRNETVATTVTVPDGEPMVIGGMGNLRDEANNRFGGLLQGQQVLDHTNPLLIVTPHILHEAGPE